VDLRVHALSPSGYDHLVSRLPAISFSLWGFGHRSTSIARDLVRRRRNLRSPRLTQGHSRGDG